MANHLDLAELEAGTKDLSGSDFSGADLSNRVLTDRNLEQSKLQNTTLSGADLSRSVFTGAATFQMQARGASFVEANWANTALVYADLSEADFRRARFESSVIQSCKLDRAILTGANFLNATFQDDCSFSGCLVDEHTDFSGVRISRAMARDYVFRFYRFERGTLFRKTPEEMSTTDEQPAAISPRVVEIERIRRSLDEALEALTKLSAHDDISPTAHPLQGHNNPPPDVVFTREEQVELANVLEAAKKELSAEQPNAEPFGRAINYSGAALKKTLEYVLQKTDLAITKATEEAGKTLGNPGRWPALYLVLAGKLQAVIDSVGPLFSKLL